MQGSSKTFRGPVGQFGWNVSSREQIVQQFSVTSPSIHSSLSMLRLVKLNAHFEGVFENDSSFSCDQHVATVFLGLI